MYLHIYIYLFSNSAKSWHRESNRNAHSGGRRGCNFRHIGPNLYAEVFIIEALSRKLDVASDNDSTHAQTFPYFRNKAIKVLRVCSVDVFLAMSVFGGCIPRNECVRWMYSS
jgi:hypothetical protein